MEGRVPKTARKATRRCDSNTGSRVLAQCLGSLIRNTRKGAAPLKRHCAFLRSGRRKSSPRPLLFRPPSKGRSSGQRIGERYRRSARAFRTRLDACVLKSGRQRFRVYSQGGRRRRAGCTSVLSASRCDRRMRMPNLIDWGVSSTRMTLASSSAQNLQKILGICEDFL